MSTFRLPAVVLTLTAAVLSACGSDGTGEAGGSVVDREMTISGGPDGSTATLVIESISHLTACTQVLSDGQPIGSQAQNGYLILLQLRGSNDGSLGVGFTSSDMVFRSADGQITDHVDTAQALACLAHEERFNEWAIVPGESSGGLVLDVPSLTGTILYTDASGEVLEWEVDVSA